MAKSWIELTSFSDSVKNMSYSELIEAYGEKRGAEVAKHFGIKKKTFKKKKEVKDTEEAGE